MKTILENHNCLEWPRQVKVEIENMKEDWDLPRQFVIDGALLHRHAGTNGIPLRALLDTGTDITVVRWTKVRELEEFNHGLMYSPERRIHFSYNDGRVEPVPSYDLAFVLPGRGTSDHNDHTMFSEYGFLAPKDFFFGEEDMWLGQDIFNQLVVTFDGIKGTVTIIAPEDAN